jgi:aldose 1-epimerase
MKQVSLKSAALEIVILPEVGARLHRLRAFGHDILRAPANPEEHIRDPFFWGAYTMAPWCGRVDAGPVRVANRQLTLGSNFRDGSAIHGQVYAVPWEVLDEGSFRVRGGGDRWPWPYELTLEVSLDDTAASLDYALTNNSDEPMPAGLGIHPWFLRPLRVAIRAAGVYSPNWATSAHAVPVEGAFDLRGLGDMEPDLDATWTDLADPPVELEWPEGGIRSTMRARAQSLVIVAASPRDVDAIAIEPQTHAPQGLRRLADGEPDAMTLLDPGTSLRLAVELAFERTAAP